MATKSKAPSPIQRSASAGSMRPTAMTGIDTCLRTSRAKGTNLPGVWVVCDSVNPMARLGSA